MYSLDPRDYRVLLIMADIENKRGNLDAALSYIQEAKSINDKDPTIYFFEGIYYEKLDQWDKAEEAFKKPLN